MGLPPGPAAPMAAQTLHYGLFPQDFFDRGRRRFGDVFTVRVMSQTWVVLGHQEAVREVFAHGPEDVDSGRANLALRPILGTRNVLLLDGDEHLARRRLVLPPLHGERMRAYASIVEEAAARDLETWPSDAPVSALPHMQAITFEVILRAVFGVEEARQLERLKTVLRDLQGWITRPRQALIFSYLGVERLMAMRSFRRQLAAVDAEVLGEIARRRADPELERREDILSLLLQARDADGEPLSDRELRDELVTLLLAGHETTAALLAWVVHELARAPQIQARLAADEPGLADAVVQETLRLRPPLPLVLRTLRRPLRLAGHDLPAGTTVAPCSMLVHRRPELYEQPGAFRPERFLGAKPPPGGWLPFGGGVRRCVGAAFAQFEARIVVAELARRRVLRPASARPERLGRRGVVLVPADGGRVTATPR